MLEHFRANFLKCQELPRRIDLLSISIKKITQAAAACTRLSNRKVDIFFTGNVKVPTGIPTIKSRTPKCSDNFCDQECQDSPTEGAQCSCRDGYRLQPDRVSCKGSHT